MSSERAEGIPLSAIHINLTEPSITFEADNKPVAKLIFSSGTIYFNTPKEAIEEQAQPQEGPEQQAQQELELPVEREKTVTLTGRLKTKPKQGKVDRSGHPTAYARFTAHVEGEEGPHNFFASFHRAAANVALNLNKEAQITVEGYPHLNEDQKRTDTFSIIRIISYPGRPQRR